MARPEGYRKAVRLMELADRFGLPVLALVDTAGGLSGHRRRGARPGRGHRPFDRPCVSSLAFPIWLVIVGEGGSGGAVAIATANKVLMLEHSIYTVASPEASASILWRDSARAQDAAATMKITAQDLLKFGIIDGIIQRAGRRRTSRSAGCDRCDRRGHRWRSEPNGQSVARSVARGAGRQIPQHRPQKLSSALRLVHNLC